MSCFGETGLRHYTTPLHKWEQQSTNGYLEERAILQLGREERCGVDKFLDSGDLFTV